MSFATKMGLAI